MVKKIGLYLMKILKYILLLSLFFSFLSANEILLLHSYNKRNNESAGVKELVTGRSGK
jgi:hypothetical protein